MATRDYWLSFGASAVSGLSPTFIVFINGGGSNITPPSVSEPGSKGLYRFAYDATQTIAFVADGATSNLAFTDRYVQGVLDAQDTFGVTLNAVSATLSGIGSTLLGVGSTVTALGTNITALGSTVTGIGTTLAGQGATLAQVAAFLGDTSSSFGSTGTDPSTVFGFLKRSQEFWEGDNVYTKSTGVLQFLSRGSGSSTLLREKTVTDNSSTTIKS